MDNDLLQKNVALLTKKMIGTEELLDKKVHSVANRLGGIVLGSSPKAHEIQKSVIKKHYQPDEFGGTENLHEAALELVRGLKSRLSQEDWGMYFSDEFLAKHSRGKEEEK